MKELSLFRRNTLPRRRIPVCALGLLMGLSFYAAKASAAEADGPAISLAFAYTSDFASVSGGGRRSTVRFLDDLRAGLDADLERAFNWPGVTGHFMVLRNSGDRPNDTAGTLQGVDNIEVSRGRVRLFEAWMEQSNAAGTASLRAGLYDLNSEFYANDGAALLLAPAFGIGSELASTGPNGPSLFPSTALTARLRIESSGGYVQAAVLNANAGVLGDPGGVDFDFDHGVLVVAEAGVVGRGKLAFGGWRYSERQDDWRAPATPGPRARHAAGGAYLLAEHPLSAFVPGHRKSTAFARLGISDGKTTAFSGGWQAGILIEQVIESRPESRLSIGVNQAWITRRERSNGRDAGLRIGPRETAIEATYADRVVGPLTLQPSVQYVPHPAGDRDAKGVLISTLRLRIDY